MYIELLSSDNKEGEGLLEDVRYAISSIGALAQITLISDEDSIMSRGVTKTPALLIDGKLKYLGEIPSRYILADEFKKMGI